MSCGFTAEFFARAAESANFAVASNPHLPTDFSACVMGELLGMTADLTRGLSVVAGNDISTPTIGRGNDAGTSLA